MISEGGSPSQGQGTGDLEKLVILSPTTGIPQVRWRRNRITVRPDEGWQRDRVYRVELLPGVTDLRRNRSNQGALVTFSTGAPRPDTTFEGTVVDWSIGPARASSAGRRAQLPDSLPYRGLADSSGHFSLGPASRRRVRRERRAGREPEPPRRSAGGVRQRAGSRRAGQRAGAVGLRARHRPAPDPDGDRDRQRVGRGRVHPDARSPPAPPAGRGAALPASRFHAGEGGLDAPAPGGRQPPREASDRAGTPPAPTPPRRDTTGAPPDRARRPGPVRRPAAPVLEPLTSAAGRSATSWCCGRPRPGGRERATPSRSEASAT